MWECHGDGESVRQGGVGARDWTGQETQEEEDPSDILM